MNNFSFLFAALAAIWVLVFLYTWRLGRLSTELQTRLDAIERRLNER